MHLVIIIIIIHLFCYLTITYFYSYICLFTIHIYTYIYIAADFLWTAVEQYIPDARQRSDKRVEQIGTPLTHERFLRRSYGTYGPRIKAGSGDALPGHKTP